MKQTAKIVQINGQQLICEIQCADACAACKAKSLCGGGGSSKQITLLGTGHERHVGDLIEVEVSSTTGFRAVLLAYLIPAVLIIATLIVMQSVHVSELAAGLTTLGVVALYYICVKIFGIGRSISITIVE